jgi:peptidoglycan/LPS O-acetylase OafA/YrhL
MVVIKRGQLLSQTEQVLSDKAIVQVTTESTQEKKLEVKETKVKGRNIVVLDGVRACAILAVMSFHISQKADPWDIAKHPFLSSIETFGGSGVTLFFILSGFLLFLPFAKSLLFQAKWPSIRQFYLKRVLRIMPGYYVALFVIILLSQQKYLQPAYWKQLLLFLTFFMDSSHSTSRQLNGPFWTLAVEWQFYMVLPLIALGFLLVAKRLPADPLRRLCTMLGCCVVLIAWGLMLRFIGDYYSSHQSPSRLLSIALIFLYGVQGKYYENFAVGMIICLCYTYAFHPVYGVALRRKIEGMSLWLGAVGLLLLMFTAIWHFNVTEMKLPIFRFMDVLDQPFNWSNEMVIALGYGSCMTAILFGPPLLQKVFSWKPLCSIGLVSYGLYMWHLPLLTFFSKTLLPYLSTQGIHFGNRSTYLLDWIWIAVVAGAVALASYLFIEKPWIQLGSYYMQQRREQKPGKLAS